MAHLSVAGPAPLAPGAHPRNRRVQAPDALVPGVVHVAHEMAEDLDTWSRPDPRLVLKTSRELLDELVDVGLVRAPGGEVVVGRAQGF